MKKFRIILRTGGHMMVMLDKLVMPKIVSSIKADCTKPGILSISPTGDDADTTMFVRIEEIVAIEELV